MNSLGSSMYMALSSTLEKASLPKAAEIRQAIQQPLDAALVSAKTAGNEREIDDAARRLKESALDHARNAEKTLQTMIDDPTKASASKQPLLASQLEWKGEILKATISMFAAGALEGPQVFLSDLAPRTLSCPSPYSSGLATVCTDVQQRATFATGWAQQARAQTTTSNNDKYEWFEENLAGVDRHVPHASNDQTTMSWGHVNEVLWIAYEAGLHAGINHAADSR